MSQRARALIEALLRKLYFVAAEHNDRSCDFDVCKEVRDARAFLEAPAPAEGGDDELKAAVDAVAMLDKAQQLAEGNPNFGQEVEFRKGIAADRAIAFVRSLPVVDRNAILEKARKRASEIRAKRDEPAKPATPSAAEGGLDAEERANAENNWEYIQAIDHWAISKGLLPDPLPYEGGGEACAKNIIAGVEAEFARLAALATPPMVEAVPQQRADVSAALTRAEQLALTTRGARPACQLRQANDAFGALVADIERIAFNLEHIRPLDENARRFAVEDLRAAIAKVTP